jgi:hypothetical protein
VSGGVRAARASLAALAAAALLAGCDRIANARPERALERRVARLLPAIERNTGLKFKRQPRVEVRSSADVRAVVEQGFRESRAARDLAGYEAAYKALGLIPPALDLRKILLDLLEEQVAGFYDPKAKALYVVSGASAKALDLTVAHELVHALQDQYVDLDSVRQADVDNDVATAAQAAIEGHATYVSLLDVARTADVAALPGGWGTIASGIRDQSALAEGLGAAPAAVREALIFPYAGGLPFVAAAYPAHGGVALVADAPRSTEQVLHPAAFGAPRDRPTRIVLPAPGGGTLVYENTLGEFETRLVLAEHLRDTAAAARGAAGWDGDRYTVLEFAGGARGIVWATVWDSDGDADEFRALLARAMTRRYRAADGALDGGAATAGGRALTVRAARAGGRPLVLFSDLPDGAAAPLDPAKLVLREE